MPDMELSDPAAFREQVQPLCGALGSLIDIAQAMRDEWGYLPAESSEAMRERAEEHAFAGEWGKDPAVQAHNIAGLMIAAAEDEMGSISELLLSPKTHVFGPLVMGRSALELCGRAVWLAEPHVGCKARIERVMTERIYSAGEAGKFPEQQENAKAVRRRLLDEGERQGFKKHSLKNQHVVRLGDSSRPTQTTAIRRVLGDADDNNETSGLGFAVMKYYSAVTHGTLWGLLQSVGPVDPRGDVVDGLAAMRVSSRGANVTLAALLFGYAVAFETFRHLHGWQSEAWEHERRTAWEMVNRRVVRPEQPPS